MQCSKQEVSQDKPDKVHYPTRGCDRKLLGLDISLSTEWISVTNTKFANHLMAIYTVEIVNEQLGPDGLMRTHVMAGPGYSAITPFQQQNVAVKTCRVCDKKN